MRTFVDRVALLLALAFAALAVSDSAVTDSSALLVGAIAAVTLVALAGSRYAAVSIRSRSMTVGARARAHRELLESLPEPSHPDTAGRTRSRAPSKVSTAA